MAYNPKAKYTIHNGDMLSVLPTLEGKFHAVLCDPPYGIAFMGKAWDDPGGPAAFQAQTKTWGDAILPLLLPGAVVFMFGSTRMWHRLAAGMEDAGFQLWDTIMWVHGQGFPKGQDVSKLIDNANKYERKIIGRVGGGIGQGWANDGLAGYKANYEVGEPSEIAKPWEGHKTCALKPSWEPVMCFRAPSQGKTYAELAQVFGSGAIYIDGARIGSSGGSEFLGKSERTGAAKNCYGDGLNNTFQVQRDDLGRYPANFAIDEDAAAILDKQIGEKGVASRFFYCAKPSNAERDGGLDKNNNNNHPTVKPSDLNVWLATLLLPPASAAPRRMLIPFSGVGSEMIGALGAGWDEVVGVEMDPRYCDIARHRIKYHNNVVDYAVPLTEQKLEQPKMF